MRSKIKLLLILILLCNIINSIFITTMAAAETVTENATQSPEEIAKIKAANEEYDRTHPKPKTPPPPLPSMWQETAIDDKSIKFHTVQADNEMVVYTEKNSNTYHMGYCKYYEEKSGGDYSNPQWLADIVMSGTRCKLCISDETYYIYKEAVYRQKLTQQEYWINLMKNIIITLIVIYIISLAAFVAYLVIRKKRSKNKTYEAAAEKHIEYSDKKIKIEYSDFIKEVGVIRGVVYEFNCPQCGGSATGVISEYNGHPHIHCSECGMSIIA